MARILLTGATGYIGRGLVPLLESNGHEVFCLVRPGATPRPSELRTVEIPRSVDALAESLDAIKPDLVVHLASLFLSSHLPGQAIDLVESNVAFPSMLLEAMKSAGIRRFLNTGTIFQSADGGPGSPFNLYAATKQAFEEVIHHYARNEGFVVLTLRLADTYGMGDTRRKLVQLLVDAAVAKESLGLSPGEQKLSLTWVEDVRAGFVQGVRRLLAREDAGVEVFGLCNPGLVKVRQLGELVQEAVGYPVDFRWGERSYRPGEIMEPTLPPALPGWKPQMGIRDGIQALIGNSNSVRATACP